MSQGVKPDLPQRYPIVPAPDDDRRFTIGFILDVDTVLQRHGFPTIRDNGHDYMNLQLALFRFLYRAED